MKATAPRTPDEYFQKTEHAVEHLYAGLDSCLSCYRAALEHWDITKVGQPKTPEGKAALNTYLELADKYFHLKFSETTFAGAILQVAYMGIRLLSPLSRENDAPANHERLIRLENGKIQKEAIRFCIGPERYGVPVGLIIYAARNQYNHWDDETLHDVPQNVFRALSAAFSNDMWFDLAFDLDNPTITVYASEVLLVALGWTTYDKYLAGMKSMLAPS